MVLNAPPPPLKGPMLPNVPGNFYMFWNLLVPLSILLNIHKFGLRAHELGLLVLLWVNPLLLKYITQSPLLSWANLILIIIWMERILKRWAWYRIYSVTFFRNLILLILFLAIPGFIMKYIWMPIYFALPDWLENNTLCHNKARMYSSIMLLLASVTLLLHSIYFFTHTCGCLQLPQCPQMYCCFFKKPKHKPCFSDSCCSCSD